MQDPETVRVRQGDVDTIGGDVARHGEYVGHNGGHGHPWY